jgi:hypothetical protein
MKLRLALKIDKYVDLLHFVKHKTLHFGNGTASLLLHVALKTYNGRRVESP